MYTEHWILNTVYGSFISFPFYLVSNMTLIWLARNAKPFETERLSLVGVMSVRLFTNSMKWIFDFNVRLHSMQLIHIEVVIKPKMNYHIRGM